MGKSFRTESGAFTLVELLVVIAIIALLVGILVPTVTMVVRQSEDVRARARMAELGMGCDSYRHEYNAAYPGQEYPNELAGSGGGFTGSHWLTRSLFTDPAGTSAATIYPQPKLVPLKEEEDVMAPFQGHGGTGTYSTIQYGVPSDRASRAMPILYYPARLGVTGLAQYVANDNASIVTAYGGSTSGFPAFVTDSSTTGANQPANEAAYVMIGAGMDRQYFTGDDIKHPQW